MALTNFGGRSFTTCDISLYARTGFTVDHGPFSFSEVLALTPAVKNQYAALASNYEIAAVRVAMPSNIASEIDYAVISERAMAGGALSPEGNSVSVSSTSGLGGSAFYFVTGFSTKNRGVVEFYLALDNVTTLENILGAGSTAYTVISSFGGFFTRVPIDDDKTIEANTLVEPFTQAFPTQKKITRISIDDIKLSGGETAGRPIQETVILSPYNIPAAAKQDISSSDRLKLAEVKAAGVKTTASVGDYEVDTGFAAFPDRDSTYEGIARLYNLGITNAVQEAYIPYVGAVNISSFSGGNEYISKLPGIYATYDYTPVAYKETDLTEKQKQYGRYLILLSLSSGESQTVKLSDCLNDDGTVTVDVATDPSPNGCAYARIRDRIRNLGNVPNAMLPGGVKSATWPRVNISVTSGDHGVAQGGAWRSAELDIDGYTAALNQKATAAQYDLAAGGGYLMKNAGNAYGLQSLSARMDTQSQMHGNALAQNTLSQVNNALSAASNTMSAFGNAGPDQTLVGWAGGVAGAVASGVTGAVGIGLDRQAENISYSGQQMQNSISQTQMTEQGEYQTALLQAQGAAANAMASAQIQKIDLMKARLEQAPEVPVLSTESRGILQRNVGEYILIDAYMNDIDIKRFKESGVQFGQTVYIPVADYPMVSHNDNRWRFYKIDVPGDAWGQASDGTNKAPGWLIRGALSQISGGLWVKG